MYFFWKPSGCVLLALLIVGHTAMPASKVKLVKIDMTSDFSKMDLDEFKAYLEKLERKSAEVNGEHYVFLNLVELMDEREVPLSDELKSVMEKEKLRITADIAAVNERVDAASKDMERRKAEKKKGFFGIFG